ncbi:ABC transporter permease [Lacrimispora algidixylanolytica]|uniref:ABC transporter permease n=1 Tax=Lacrimispora algidixylanolytica TaxID=94868 RepID=A0A419T0R0_9FIRM|nr:ABC transporter permease [Lacrimispora algidixylanolytica]RKD31047.1 ABC transporter permease [Lacrimispora algidixylanolytica]
MMGLLVLKERLKGFYARFDIYVNPLIKFIFSCMAFFLMNGNIGFSSKLTEPFVPLVLALVCSFLPYGAISFLASGFMLIHLSGISLEITLVMAIFIVVVGLLYYGFQPGDSYLLVLTPLFFLLKIPYAIPLIVGLSGSIVSVIPVSCGVFIYYTLLYVKQNAGVLTNDMSVNEVQKFMQIMNSLLANKQMLLMVGAFALALLVVVIVRNLSVDYSWLIAIIAGTITQLSVIFIGDIALNVTVSVLGLLLGMLVSILISAIYTFFVFAVDYSRTEYVQFEDDDYYYYVKAVPKLTVSTPDVKVQKINATKLQRPQR